jgi:hypothetical protein
MVGAHFVVSTPASLITFAHFSISALMKLPKYSGVPPAGNGTISRIGLVGNSCDAGVAPAVVIEKRHAERGVGGEGPVS